MPRRLKAAIDAYHQQRISAAEFYQQVRDIRDAVVNGGHDDGTPELLRKRPRALTIYSNIRLHEGTQALDPASVDQLLPELALKLEATIHKAVTAKWGDHRRLAPEGRHPQRPRARSV